MATHVQFFGWDAVLVESSQGTRVIIDPLLGGNEKRGIPPSPVGVDDLGSIDLVCATHMAAEHLGNTWEVMEKYADAHLIGGTDVGVHANQHGYSEPERYSVVVSGCTYRHKDVTVRALDARHFSWSIIDGHPASFQAFSWLVTTDDGFVLFHGGDTSVSLDMRLYGELYRPDVACVGVSGPQVGAAFIAEMDPLEAAVALDLLGARIAIPLHYTEKSHVDEFIGHAATRAPRARVVPLEPGEILVVEPTTAGAAARS